MMEAVGMEMAQLTSKASDGEIVLPIYCLYWAQNAMEIESSHEERAVLIH